MKKRMLSFAVAVMMLIGTCSAIPTFAEAAPPEVLEDYAPGDIPDNLITTYPTEGNLNINAGEVRATASGSVATLSAVADCGGHPSLGLQGFNIDRLFIPALSGTGYTPAFSKGAKVLFSGKMRKAADATQNPRINVVYASEGYGKKYYPDNYASGSSGLLLTGTEWTDFKTVMTAPEDFGGQYWYFLLGFSNGTKSGAKAELDMSSFYFGEEVAHDIRLAVDGKTDVEAGAESVIYADADIINQLGDAYSDQGDFHWYALDETRTQIVPGITVVPQEDGLATIHIGASVSDGNYVIAAQSVEQPEMVKSFSVAVGTKDWSDHEAVSVESWYKNAETANNWSGNLDGTPAFTIGAGAVGTTITGTDLIANHGEMKDRVMGIFFPEMVGAASGTPTKEHPAGTQFAVSFRVRNLTPDKTAKVNAGIYAWGELRSIMTDAYPSIDEKDCFLIEGTEWNEFFGVITLPKALSFEWYSMDIGFPSGTEPGTTIEIDDASFYFAPYKPCDLSITDISGTGILDPGVKSAFAAHVVDFAGKAMDIDGDFDWALINEEKTARVSGVEFTEDESDQNTVYAVADKTVAPGNYYLAAESKSGAAAGWIKSIPVQVIKATVHDYVAGTIPGDIYDIAVSRTDAGNETLGLTDTASFSAKVTDKSGSLVLGEQNFNWLVMDETRKDVVTEEFTVVPSEDTTAATVSPKLTTANGTYYVMAQHKENDAIVKAVKIAVDKAQSVEDAAELINSGETEKIAEKFQDLATIVETSDKTQAALAEESGKVKEKAAEILSSSFGGKLKLPTDDMNAVKDAIETATAYALYDENPDSVFLYDKNGAFLFADEMNLESIDTDGVTLYEVFKTVLSDEGRKEMQAALEDKKVETIEGFTDAIKENIILYGVKYPDEIGVSYLEDILTEENLKAADFDVPTYLEREDRSEIHKEIARTLYTKKTLTEALEAENEEEESEPSGGSSGGGGGSSGGGGGSLGGGRKDGYKVPIEVTPSEKEEEQTSAFPKFSDVAEAHWAYSDIYYLRERNIINGVDDTHFNPDGYITREQFAKILCAALKLQVSDGKTAFSDVDENAWYGPFVSAVFEKGIVNGISSDAFGVGKNITRQDLCTMLARATENKSASATPYGFTDETEIADYAKEGVALLVNLGAVNGYEDGSFRPQGLCTRAECAKIICKMLEEWEVSGK